MVGLVGLWALFAPGSLARTANAVPVPVAVAVALVLAWFARRPLHKIVAFGRVLLRGRRNRTDLVRHLVLRPAVFGAIGAYEAAVLVSSRVEARLKYLASLKTSSIVGCPF
jgi:hypothetical protein